MSRIGNGQWAMFLTCSSILAASLPSSIATPDGLLSTALNTCGLDGASSVLSAFYFIIT